MTVVRFRDVSRNRAVCSKGAREGLVIFHVLSNLRLQTIGKIHHISGLKQRRCVVLLLPFVVSDGLRHVIYSSVCENTRLTYRARAHYLRP